VGRCAGCWTRALREPGLSSQGWVAFGGPWLLDQLWQRLGIGAAHWVGRKAWIDRLPETSDDACYRAVEDLAAGDAGNPRPATGD
jgi:hypothetical protein